MHHALMRQQAIKEMSGLARKTVIPGPPNNLDFLLAILQSPKFSSENIVTAFLDDLKFSPAAIDVLSGGAYTTTQNHPRRPILG